MKTFREAIQDYLTLRRGLGFKLKKHSRMLEEFASFLEQKGALRITSRLALQWATEPQTHPAGGMGCAVECGARIRALLECHGPVD
jgi:integrase/recombinase XerD